MRARRRASGSDRTLRVPAAVLCLAAAAGCSGSLNLTPSDHPTVLSRQLLDAPHPARPGPRAVERLFYGSGTDRNRPEYRDSVTIVTDPVDASKLVDLGEAADERNAYWGFSPDSFPLNARVWAPVGEGPFPLVLIVHGNHDMRDFSDPGYAYLGELLASRGFLFASIDMNFLNGSIREENDARGWLLLKHLEAWRAFDADPGNPFHRRVDMERIALIGHSRGGEAVGHAAAFNRLDRYPDDASLTFDFGFGIRSIVAIAPVDGQYLPTGRHVPVEDVSYMVFHGSHDGDVSSFHGLRQYQRVSFTDGRPRFKTAVYMYRANHGQWNTVWGNEDRGPRSARSLELGGLIEPEAQREFGKIYISAFLEATLRDDGRYLPLFRDHRVIGGWLPETMYVTRFQASGFRPLATFDEDIDVTSGAAPGIRLRGDSLAIWREDLLELRSRNRPNTSSSQQSHAVWLGWNRAVAGREEPAPPARFAVELPPSLPAAWDLDGASTLDLLLAALDERPEPRRGDSDPAARGGRGPGVRDSEREEQAPQAEAAAEPEEGPPGEEAADEPVDLSVELVDGLGRSGRVRLSDYGPIRKPLEIKVLRRNDEEAFARQWELVLQSFSIPLDDFARDGSGFDPRLVREVRLVFDRTEAGTVVVDEIGFSKLGPGFFLDGR